MIDAGIAAGDVDTGQRTGRAPAVVAAVLLAGLGLLFVTIVLGSVTIGAGPLRVEVKYKILARTLPLVWLATLLVPSVRRQLGYRPLRSDLPLALFAVAAALSVVAGGGHWGDVRSLVAGIGLAVVARTLFAAPERRPLFLLGLSGLALFVLARELAAHPELFPPNELQRYGLVTANPNVLGFLFAMCAPLFLGEAMTAWLDRARAAAPRESAGGTAIAYGAWMSVSYAIAVTGVLVTFSRTAAFGLAFGTLVVVLHARRRTAAVLVAALLGVVFLVVQRPDVWTSTRATGDADRLRIVRTSLSLAAESPLLGIGFGINNLEERFPDRFEALYGERLFRFHSANQVVDLLVGTGVIGTAIALWWIMALARELRETYRDALGWSRARVAGHVGALTAIALMSLTEPPLYAGKVVPVLFLIIGYVQSGVRRRA